MADIYHALVKHEWSQMDEKQLRHYQDTCDLAYQSITDALRLIGNLTYEASQSEEYTDQDARRDFFLAGSALRDLPRIAQALQHNSHMAGYQIRRKGNEQ